MTRRKKSFPFFLWHRRLGLAALILIFILSITGIMLNHTEYFKLDETPVKSDFILNWYGINPEGTPVNYSLSDLWITQWNQQIFFNGKSLLTHSEIIHGITITGNIIAIALTNHVLLLDTDGEVIELMRANTQFEIDKIGLFSNRVALLDLHDNFYLSDSELTAWKQQNSNPVKWSQPTELTNEKLEILKKAYRGQGLNLERLILDLHSGRIFNAQWGIYIMDASAIIMILLGISGLWVWWTRKLKIRKKKHYRKHH